jgi:hypothetical protein
MRPEVPSRRCRGIAAGGLLSGSIVPDVQNIIAGKTDPLKDLSLLLVVGFIVGFAERLVPDTLTRIAAQMLGRKTAQRE